MRRIIAVTITLLLVITALTALLLTHVYIVESNQIDESIINQDPFYKLTCSQNNSVIYGTDNLNITLTWKTILIYDYDYSVDLPIARETFVGNMTIMPEGLIPLNLTITSEKPITKNLIERTFEGNIALQNLTVGKHSVTLYYSDYDSIITTWKHYTPGATINFSVDNSTPAPIVPRVSSTIDSFSINAEAGSVALLTLKKREEASEFKSYL